MVELLIKKGADVSATNKEGATALHRATEENNTDIITVLLRHGAKVGSGKVLRWDLRRVVSGLRKGSR